MKKRTQNEHYARQIAVKQLHIKYCRTDKCFTYGTNCYQQASTVFTNCLRKDWIN